MVDESVDHALVHIMYNYAERHLAPFATLTPADKGGETDEGNLKGEDEKEEVLPKRTMTRDMRRTSEIMSSLQIKIDPIV